MPGQTTGVCALTITCIEREKRETESDQMIHIKREACMYMCNYIHTWTCTCSSPKGLDVFLMLCLVNNVRYLHVH